MSMQVLFQTVPPIEIELICRAIGLVGFLLYVVGFFCLCLGRLHSGGRRYFVMVFTAACCVLISLSVDFNLSAALIQGFYILMSLGGIIMRCRKADAPLERANPAHDRPRLSS